MSNPKDAMPASNELTNSLANKSASENPTSLRRNFLLGTTLGAVGAVVAVVAGEVPEVMPVAALDAAASEPKKVRGYHLSEHIAQYYDTTRI